MSLRDLLKWWPRRRRVTVTIHAADILAGDSIKGRRVVGVEVHGDDGHLVMVTYRSGAPDLLLPNEHVRVERKEEP